MTPQAPPLSAETGAHIRSTNMRHPTQNRQALYEDLLANDPSHDGFVLEDAPVYGGERPPRNLRNVTQIGPRLWIATSCEDGCKIVMVADSRSQAVFGPDSWDDASAAEMDVERQQRWFKHLCKRQGRRPHQGAVVECRWGAREYVLERTRSMQGVWRLLVDGPSGPVALPADAGMDWLDDEHCLVARSGNG